MDQDQIPERRGPSEEGNSSQGDEGGGGGGSGGGGFRGPRGMREQRRITISDPALINYKNIEFLRQFVTDQGKIRPRRQTGITARHQRLIANAVKRARHLALLPFDREMDRR